LDAYLVECQPGLNPVTKPLEAKLRVGHVVCDQFLRIFRQKGFVAVMKFQWNVEVEKGNGRLDTILQQGINLSHE
jgi:hypothetical protein